jgi:hypothetical protein
MPDYRIIEINKSGRVVGPPHHITCDNDGDAVQKAKPLMDVRDIEVWEGDRVVAQIRSAEGVQGRFRWRPDHREDGWAEQVAFAEWRAAIDAADSGIEARLD